MFIVRRVVPTFKKKCAQKKWSNVAPWNAEIWVEEKKRRCLQGYTADTVDTSTISAIYSGISHWKWPFIVDLPIENGDFPTSTQIWVSRISTISAISAVSARSSHWCLLDLRRGRRIAIARRPWGRSLPSENSTLCFWKWPSIVRWFTD